ncbi:MAG: hypothetical protein COW18_06635 [Zetaproteobacteria bacterium CG12_big_fil_rev_8_21_14_0_65_54_13]|nr:MAG: hypothetical protein COX55_06095 [Zetaproteobacteria bacterium CG23_combo_of_CG06-09_8_20_14_all_54_7]PIW48775.1 MAG: hypothetical protein COW18_06635 [Zetaproteobacteria bacterium CG12_big_fil_rev_8_21_14_0_65_54_13]PIX53575.1 MAG: hypothetical protein COZ50_12520 [Zetaproteobacteria bacterium CG_4_10_14_3_um_filter_54_28]PJA31116.1 MAG: hypothetical protein CO188_00480 [Zetaproteobacteria bacterium CG_4_9_14_3_um_filter_54_145]
MNSRVKALIDQMKQLEEELSSELQQQEDSLLFQLNGKKVEFEQSIRQAHRKLKINVWCWLVGVRPINIITAPIIYGMIIPLLIVDLSISFYQFSCFPIYKIAKVRRRDYIVFDRHHLAYLNIFEKFHCLYCAYGNGLIAYVHEILARTELYFCPIKHAHKLLATHRHYRHFIAYGDAKDYPARLEAMRQSLAEKPKS